ncbi:MAG TPA: hypothetical protein VHE60_06520 [Pyrinomonadaceae bacterium]|nr:hypothetical protein [Pyrinomonadaceae bacterium]
MISDRSAVAPGSHLTRLISLLTALALFAAPLSAQQRRAPAPAKPTPTFDNLLAADSYEVYGEVRNVGQLLSTGGAGEIVDPITKLAEPPKEFQAIIKFLKSNSEALATSRLLFATSPARPEIPATFVAIEFSSPEEADKFAPKLEKFLPAILPPVPDATPSPTVTEVKPTDPAQAKPSVLAPPAAKQIENEAKATPTATLVATPTATVSATPQPPAEHLPFVITHAGNLVCISDKPFKFEKLHPAGSKPLAEDQNFRVAHDRFPSESVFLFFNVALEARAKPQPSPKQQITEEEAERIRQEEAELIRKGEEEEARVEMARNASAEPTPPPPQINEGRATLRGTLSVREPSPTPTPTKEQQAQRAASSRILPMIDLLGRGEPQWPEAVGVALTFDNNEYVIRAILVESQNARRLPLPFVPQLISGPAYTPNAPSVLPDDTEVFVSASIDFLQTHEGMRKQADIALKTVPRQITTNDKGELLDPFAAFEKKAGFKIKEDLLPVLGNEMAMAGSLKLLQGAGIFGMPAPPSRSAKPSPETADEKQKAAENFPILLIAIKDRDAARPLMPRVFDGLGLGEANLIAQTEKREDTELVNYGGVFAYAFVGNFLVISEAAAVRRVIEANVNHQTLSSNSAFRNFRRWQPRQILGEVYVSPALMEGYQDEIRKQSATMDEKMRDFLMQLSPTANAISYALTNEGFGEVHELHLPKNLIIAMVAGTTAAMSAMKAGSPEMNEAIAESLLRMISSAEASYQATAGNGSYGSLDKLVEAKLVQKEMFDKYGYNIQLSASGNQFEATATPIEYGKTGKRSFFVDQSGVIRGDDHGGGPATALDKPVQGP